MEGFSICTINKVEIPELGHYWIYVSRQMILIKAQINHKETSVEHGWGKTVISQSGDKDKMRSVKKNDKQNQHQPH